MSVSHEIVILGGNFAAIQSAHYLLKHTIPALESVSPKINYHVTIIAPNTRTYYKIGAPRAIAAPTKISTSELFLSIEEQFAYSHQISFVQGWATSVEKSRKIQVSLVSGSVQTVHYDSLIIATGSKFNSDLWNLTGEHTTTESVITDMHTRLAKARTIYIGGGGAVGVETSAEIAEAFPNAEITLLSGTSRVLPRLSEKTSRRAEQQLTKLNIATVHNLKVTSTTPQTSGRSLLTFNNGHTTMVDVYIDSTGGKPNTSFLPKSWLDIYGFVSVDECLRGNKIGMENIYAIGDCASYSSCTNMDVFYAVRPLCRSVGVDLAPRVLAKGRKVPKALKQVVFKGMRDTLIVCIGSKGGVMQVLGWGCPSWVVRWVKGRDFWMDGAEKVVSGKDFEKV